MCTQEDKLRIFDRPATVNNRRAVRVCATDHRLARSFPPQPLCFSPGCFLLFQKMGAFLNGMHHIGTILAKALLVKRFDEGAQFHGSWSGYRAMKGEGVCRNIVAMACSGGKNLCVDGVTV
jgi:hypothetical protein